MPRLGLPISQRGQVHNLAQYQEGRSDQETGRLARKARPGRGLDLESRTLAYNPDGTSAHPLELQVGSTPVACTIYEPGHVWDHHLREAEIVPEALVTVPSPLLAPVFSEMEQVDVRTVEQDRISTQGVWRIALAVEQPRAPAWVIGSLVHEALSAWRFPAEVDSDFHRWGEVRAWGYGTSWFFPQVRFDAAPAIG